MIEMKEQAWKKREELYTGIAQLGISLEEAKKILRYLEDECIIEITSPQKEEPSFEMVIMQSSRTGQFEGRRYTPGNIIFNMKEAPVESLAFAASTVASIGAVSISQPVVFIFTILAAALSAASLSKKALDDKAALILAVLWENRYTYNQSIDEEAGLKLVNKYLESYKREKLSEIQYKDLLKELSNIKSIELNDGKIKLNERICIKY